MKTYISFLALLLTAFTLCTKDIKAPTYRDALKDQQVAFINFMFSDFNGIMREVTIPIDFVTKAVKDGIGFDGSSIAGYTRIIDSDMLLKPNMQTLHILPWTDEENKTARVICDVYTDDHTPYTSDPRYVLKTVLEEARAMGFDFHVGPEIEFFLCDQDPNNTENFSPCDSQRYFSAETNAFMANFKCNLLRALKAQNIPIEKLHHEVAPGQHEVVIRYGNALTVADNIIITKQTITALAQLESLTATFMPKPFYGQNGSGMHIHFSLWDRTKNCNAFYSKEDPQHLSKTARHFVAGVLTHIIELNAIFNPTVNSYKRLVPGYEAPTNICWGTKNRSTMIRIPYTNEDQPNAIRAEIRSPDPLCNPYLAFAALLKAGLQGIKNEIELSPAIEENLYQLTDKERKTRNIASLPSSLEQAIAHLQSSELAHNLLGDHLFEEFINYSKQKVAEFNMFVTDWELQAYF